MHPPLGFLDLFSGIGGLSSGLTAAGLTPLGAVDNWADAVATFAHNHSDVPVVRADLKTVHPDHLTDALGIMPDAIDLIAGGPPCQGFSTVGKRDASDPRNQLWTAFHRCVMAVRPAYVLIENVEGLKVTGNGEFVNAIVGEFEGIGYRMTCGLLRAADYGVPQLRKRMFLLGWLDGLVEPRFPRPSGKDHVSVADAIFDLPELQPGEAKSTYSTPPRTAYQRERRGASRELHNHEAANHPPALIAAIRHVPDGGNRKSIPPKFQPKSGFHNSYARLASWKPAIAVTSNMRKPSSARATHPIQHRGLTVREGLRLQSFDDDFVVLGSRTSQYLQVGNAVPPLLAEAVGRSLMTAFAANSPADVLAVRNRPARPISSRHHVRQLTFWANESA